MKSQTRFMFGSQLDPNFLGTGLQPGFFEPPAYRGYALGPAAQFRLEIRT
jgi:hypothetical protein